MMIDNGDGTHTGGPLDVWCVLQHSGRYHPCFLTERPMPGPIEPVGELKFVRLQSWGHHTSGFETLEDALASLDAVESRTIVVSEENVWREPLEWDGEPFVMVVENWRHEKKERTP